MCSNWTNDSNHTHTDEKLPYVNPQAHEGDTGSPLPALDVVQEIKFKEASLIALKGSPTCARGDTGSPLRAQKVVAGGTHDETTIHQSTRMNSQRPLKTQLEIVFSNIFESKK